MQTCFKAEYVSLHVRYKKFHKNNNFYILYLHVILILLNFEKKK